MADLRIIKKRLGNEWATVSMNELVPGDVFRMNENTGEPVVWDDTTKWLAISDPYEAVNEDSTKTWAIEVSEITEEVV
jgi:hypothetical protein